MKKAPLTMAERLAELSAALRRTAREERGLEPVDLIAIADALHGEVRRLRDQARHSVHSNPQTQMLSTRPMRALLRRPANYTEKPA
jgi:hypothetical protein